MEYDNNDDTTEHIERLANESVPPVTGYDDGWINCRDDTPESYRAGWSMFYLVFCDNGRIYVSYYDYEGTWYIENELDIMVTHWMPLPEPPNHV